MKTYSPRVSAGPLPGPGPVRAAWQPSALQRAIDEGTRMQVQRQQAHTLRQPAVVQAKPGWLKTLLHTTKETTTAHSPGIYTGPVSTVNYGALGNNVAHYQAIKDSGFTAYPTASTNMGYATTSANMLGDVVGGAFSIKTMYQNRPFSTVSGWNSDDYATKKDTRAAFTSAATDLGGQVLDAGSQITSAIGNASQLGTAAVNAAHAAPFLGGVVNLGVGIRAAFSAGRAGTYRRRLKALAKPERDWEFLNDTNRNAATERAPLQEQVEFAQNQMKKREVRQGIGAFGAAVGTAGAIALGVAGVCATAAVMATPVGWALAGAGAAVALGIGAYKGYQYLKKRKDGKLGTERTEHATKIIDALRGDGSARQQAEALLKARGIKDVDSLRAADRDESIKLVERKLKSW